MARTPAPPGPPPQHFRHPGSPPPSDVWGAHPLGQVAAPPTPSAGASAGAVTAVALVTLVLGLVIGFFLGRVTEADDAIRAAPPLTSPSTTNARPPGDTIAPSPPAAAPGAPPATDLQPSTIGSLEDPVPTGQAYILGLYEIEVLSATRDAGEVLRGYEAANPPPPDGRQHLIVEIAIRFTDRRGLGNPATIPFFVSDGTARWNDFEAACGSVPDSILDSGLLEAGDEAVANVCFTVPEDVVPNLRFGTEGFDGPLYFALPE